MLQVKNSLKITKKPEVFILDKNALNTQRDPSEVSVGTSGEREIRERVFFDYLENKQYPKRFLSTQMCILKFQIDKTFSGRRFWHGPNDPNYQLGEGEPYPKKPRKNKHANPDALSLVVVTGAGEDKIEGWLKLHDDKIVSL